MKIQNLIAPILPLVLLGIIAGCQHGQINISDQQAPVSREKAHKSNNDLDVPQYSQADFDYLAIKDPSKLSAASKRALERNYHKNADWFGWFSKQSLSGDFNYEPGVTRRDPSKVLFIDGLYYTWYSKAVGPSFGFGTGDPDKKVFPWDKTEIWYATSPDGNNWKEQGMAVGRGETGAYDDRSVFTPEVLAYNNKYYLVYQTIKAPYLNRTKNHVGMAVADSPDGPWKKLAKPILSPANNGVWLGEEDNRFLVKQQGDFDSHKVHDPTLLHYNNKFYLYYKGERFGEKTTAGGREIRWGVAIADQPEGPYIKSEYNPITQSGHELAIWHYQDGIAMISCKDGPEQGTMQFAKDGINFEIMSYITNVPDAIATVTSLDGDQYPGAALTWGLSHEYVIPKGKQWYEGYNYITKFTFRPNREQKRYESVMSNKEKTTKD
ncbi:glycoside hydrolase family 117 protein [Algibacillus agarilyticus]|uniref:glycoside hydrolase family 117 protein n=1 Tax=Algibacillus agarilyticus TaxID=2234133 RepID=UPI000DCFA1CC|nr:family 43 glycosylhydrolase [Algibacillus agarilyticus]